MAIVPDVGSSTPAMMLKRVLFPQPLGPMTETNSPVATVRSIVASVSRLWRPEPNVFVTFCTSNFGVSMLCSLLEHVKGRNLDVEGCGLNCLCFLARFAASLRWYYPDQVPAISTTCSNIARDSGIQYENPSHAGITQIRFNRSAVDMAALSAFQLPWRTNIGRLMYYMLPLKYITQHSPKANSLHYFA